MELAPSSSPHVESELVEEDRPLTVFVSQGVVSTTLIAWAMRLVTAAHVAPDLSVTPDITDTT
ncbi:hypothetical protein [Streptomyces sp. NPDC005805]|uniref:hypothetical protein n=1 Tax=Streptomyces sp. NPDC005805 TaxID=3157068 RepID=UPI0033E2A2D4